MTGEVLSVYRSLTQRQYGPVIAFLEGEQRGDKVYATSTGRPGREPRWFLPVSKLTKEDRAQLLALLKGDDDGGAGVREPRRPRRPPRRPMSEAVSVAVEPDPLEADAIAQPF